MKVIKILLLLIVLVSTNDCISSPYLDSLKNERVIFMVGNFNDDCYKDTLFSKIQDDNIDFIDLITWGKKDSNIVCDSMKVYGYDSLTVEFTFFDSTMFQNQIMNIVVYDYNEDKNYDLLYNKLNRDTLSSDSIITSIIYGNNSFSKDTLIKEDSINSTSYDCIDIDLQNQSTLVGNFGSLQFRILDVIDIEEQLEKRVSIKEEIDEELKVTVYPNPNGGEFNVLLNRTPFSYEIIDMKGNIIILKRNVKSEINSIDISNLTNGTYYIKIEFENKVSIQKVIKSK